MKNKVLAILNPCLGFPKPRLVPFTKGPAALLRKPAGSGYGIGAGSCYTPLLQAIGSCYFQSSLLSRCPGGSRICSTSFRFFSNNPTLSFVPSTPQNPAHDARLDRDMTRQKVSLTKDHLCSFLLRVWEAWPDLAGAGLAEKEPRVKYVSNKSSHINMNNQVPRCLSYKLCRATYLSRSPYGPACWGQLPAFPIW